MARNLTLSCDLCGTPLEQVAAKIFITPVAPGRAISYMAAYSHQGDLCPSCLESMGDKLSKRKPRSNGKNNGNNADRAATTKRKSTKRSAR